MEKFHMSDRKRHRLILCWIIISIILLLLPAVDTRRSVSAQVVPFTVAGRDPWAPIIASSPTPPTLYSPIVLREVRGGTANAAVVLTNTYPQTLSISVDTPLSLWEGTVGSSASITADVRVIGNMHASNRDCTNGLASPTYVPGPMFTKTDLDEIRRELALTPTDDDPFDGDGLTPPDMLPFVKSIPPQTYSRNDTIRTNCGYESTQQQIITATRGIVNWDVIKDFPTLRLNSGASVILWLTFDTAQPGWFTTSRRFSGGLVARTFEPGINQWNHYADKVDIQLTVEGRTSIFEEAVTETMVWGYPVWRYARQQQVGTAFSLAPSKDAYLQDVVAHTGRTHFGWDTDVFKYGFKRVLLDPAAFWPQVSGRYRNPAEVRAMLNGPGRLLLQEDLLNWATGKAPTLLPNYGLWALQIWDEPFDGNADVHAEVASLIKSYNPDIKIIANPPAGATVDGTFRKLNPYVDEWWPQVSHLHREYDTTLSYLRSTGKPIKFYSHDGGRKPKAEDSIWAVYRPSGWEVPYHGLSGRGQWAIDAFFGNPWDDFDSQPGCIDYGDPNIPTNTIIYTCNDSDVALIYPGPFGPLTTRNWEAYRRSGEDDTLARILGWRNLSATMRNELNARILAAHDNTASPNPLPAGWTPWGNGPSRFEEHHRWLVDALTRT